MAKNKEIILKKGEKRYGNADDNSFDKKGIQKGQAEEPVEMRRQDGSCAHKMADEPTKVTYSSPKDARNTTLHTRKANGVGGLVPRWLVPWLWFWVWSGSLGTVSGNSTTSTLAELKPSLNGSLSDGSLTAAMVAWRPDLLACSAESSCIACAASNGILTGAEASWELFVPCINWTPEETVLGLALCLFVSLVTTCWLGMCFWFQKKTWKRRWKKYKRKNGDQTKLCSLIRVFCFLFVFCRPGKPKGTYGFGNKYSGRDLTHKGSDSSWIACWAARWFGKSRHKHARLRYRRKVWATICQRQKVLGPRKGTQGSKKTANSTF